MVGEGGIILKGSQDSGINLVIKKRLVVLFGIIFLIMVALVVRVGWIQIINGPELQKMAVDQWTNDITIDAKRGKILDRNGEELAVSASCERVDVYMVDVRKAEKDDKDIKVKMAASLSKILGDKQEDILKILNKTLPNGKPLNSATIKRRIEKSQADEIRKLNLPGIIVSEDSKRYYPNGSFLSNVLGFTNVDGVGQEGIELKYDSALKGKPGKITMEADKYKRELPYNVSQYVEPQNGKDIVLSIDESIQLYVEKAIENALVENKAKAVTAIVMDPTTGEILAMANKPDYNPNDPRNMGNYTDFQDVVKSWSNKAVTYTYEPGSIFKVITAAAAMEENKVKDSDRFVCNGSLQVANKRIRCWKAGGHGTQTFAQILQNSCNVGFMTLGERLGKESLYKYIDAFGLCKPTGIDVPFEESGYKIPINKVGPVELANISFGQSITVTPIQMASVYAAIANNGKMMEPHLAKKILTTDKDGNITETKEIQPKMTRQVMDANKAKELSGYLEQVVSIGGSHKAYVDGYHIAGKTGTAQKVENGRYAPGKYVSSFVGFAPVDNPRFVVFVSVDEPDPSKYYASQTVAPVAGQIFKDIFISRNIPPDNAGSDIDIVLPNVVGMSQKEASSKLKNSGFSVEVKGTGTAVSNMNPLPGLKLKTGTKVILYLGNGQNYNSKVIVPNLMAMDETEAKKILGSLGLKLKINGTGQVKGQSPEVGTAVQKGATVSVDMEVPGD